MALDFPASPTTNQVFTAPNGVSWEWDGAKWSSGAIGSSAFLPLSGGTLTGPLILNADPTAPLGAATKEYSDLKLPLSGGTLTGSLVLNADPTAALGAATKEYSDQKLPLTGGTLTGELTIAPAAADANLILTKPASGDRCQILAYMTNKLRWDLTLGDITAESGSNAGSNFTIQRFDDTGAVLGTPLTIARATGTATFSQSLVADGVISAGGAAPAGTQNGLVFGNALTAQNIATNTFPSANGWTYVANGCGGVLYSTTIGATLAVSANGNAGGVFNTWAAGFEFRADGSLNLVNGYGIRYASYTANIIGFGWQTNVAGQTAMYIDNTFNGNISTTGSDRRRKSSIEPAADALAILKTLPVYACDWTPLHPDAEPRHLDFALIADEVAPLIPSAFIPGPKDGYDGLDLVPLVAALVKAVQTLAGRVETLEAAQ